MLSRSRGIQGSGHEVSEIVGVSVNQLSYVSTAFLAVV